MPVRGWFINRKRRLAATGIGLLCIAPVIAAERVTPAARARQVATARLAQDTPREQEDPTTRPVPSDIIGPAEPASSIDPDDVHHQLPEPGSVAEVYEMDLQRDLADASLTEEQRQQRRRDSEARLRKTIQRVDTIDRPDKVHLTLAEVIRRTLQHNFNIQVQSYNPAIESTQIVEAEAQFDAVFYTNFNSNKQDRPTASALQGTQSNSRVADAGVRKLLSTGMQVQTSYQITRTETNLGFQTLNPAYFNNFVTEFRQPLLQGFGLDYNRAQIEINKLDRSMSIERLRREIRETVFNVEQAYWRLQQARRRLTINARLLTELESIFDLLKQREEAGYDVYPVQLNLTDTRIQSRQRSFVQLRNAVKDAEDLLKGLMNDPDLSFARDLELIPDDIPTLEPVILDRIGEVTAALQYREELHEARMAIEQAQIVIGAAKNQALPRLDVMFRYVVDGLGGNWDQAFSQLSENDFHEYVISLELEWPIGNRGPEAALRRARLQQAQAIASRRAQIEQVILQVQQAVREVQNNYDQIAPSLRAARASQDQLRATVARRERLDPPSLDLELNAHETLGQARDALLSSWIDYNIALVNLERQKGTLLQNNNIVVRGEDDEDYQDIYRPLNP